MSNNNWLSILNHKRRAMGIILLSLLAVSGCQQTNIQFTESKPPTIPSFAPLSEAPQTGVIKASASIQNKSTKSSYPINVPYVSATGVGFTLHQFKPLQSGLTEIELIGISPNSPIKDINVLATAFRQKTHELAIENSISVDPNACLDAIQVQANLHYLSLSTRCHLSQLRLKPQKESLEALGKSAHSQPLPLLANYWQINSLDQLDISQIRRQLKLNKHINAYSGREIETIWRRVILGKPHPYNQSLDNPSTVNSLDLLALKKLQQETLKQLDWHVFIRTPLQNTQQIEALALHIMDSMPASNKNRSDKQLEETSDRISKRKTGKDKIIYVIDAPGSAQTQVRIGYTIAPQTARSRGKVAAMLKAETPISSELSCQVIAALMGRSYRGRLFYDLRGQRGLTYGIYGQCLSAPLSQTLKFSGNTRLEHSGAFIAGIVDHLTLIKQDQVSTDELKAVKHYLIGQRQLQLNSSQQNSQAYRKILSRGKNFQLHQTEFQHIDSLTSSQLLSRIQDLLASEPVIVIRGDIDKIRSDLNQKLPDWSLELMSIDS